MVPSTVLVAVSMTATLSSEKLVTYAWAPSGVTATPCGLKPTLITNGQVLANPEKCRQLKEAGVYDLLISVHGLGQRYDKIVVVNGAAAKLQKAIDNVAAAGIPFRFNCVLCTDALPDLHGVARLAVAQGARAVNFIAFNPFIDQACGGKRSAENVPKYSEVVDYLIPAIDLLDANGIEVNVLSLIHI